MLTNNLQYGLTRYHFSRMTCTAGSFSDHIEILAATIYGLVTLVLYAYLIVLIIRKSVFHHPFFYQFVLLSVTVSFHTFWNTSNALHSSNKLTIANRTRYSATLFFFATCSLIDKGREVSSPSSTKALFPSKQIPCLSTRL